VKKTLIANATPPAAQPAAQSCYCPNCEALTKELAALKERPAVQCEWCNGRGVLAGHAQDGSFDGEDCPHCAPPAQTAPLQPVGRVCFGGDEVVWTDEPPESGALLYTTPPAQSAPESGSWYAAKEMDEMVRDLDAALNGDGAAPQAKLCDLMPQLIQRLTAQPAPEQYTALEQALTRLQKRYAELEAKVAAQPAAHQCHWMQTDDMHTPDTWRGVCGAVWTFAEGGPRDNDQAYCPMCGGVCIEVRGVGKGSAA
jgi:hypothetical protein